MPSVRTRLRSFATAWLVFQVAWLAALVPADCCAAHRPAPVAEHGAEQSATAAQCPMRSADGRPCPMHRANAEHHSSSSGEHHHQSPMVPNECSLRAACDGPMAAFFAFQSNRGILPVSTVALPDVTFRTVAIVVDEELIGRFEPPDPPPPRV